MVRIGEGVSEPLAPSVLSRSWVPVYASGDSVLVWHEAGLGVVGDEGLFDLSMSADALPSISGRPVAVVGDWSLLKAMVVGDSD